MIILSIETSCDETAVSVVEADGDFPDAAYRVLGNALFSQVDLHREYGGVFPNLAKREHARTIVPMMERALEEAGLLKARVENTPFPREAAEELHELLYREEGLADSLIDFLEKYETPELDLIAVTSGPGLEPALWVGVNFVKALARITGTPVVPADHMEGHILVSLIQEVKSQKSKVKSYEIPPVEFPALSLLISGGHTQFVLMKGWNNYEIVGETRDDAVGEAFDKVARLMGLPYPGGPEISKLAAVAREKGLPPYIELPKPMLDSGDHDLSFSGLKTAVRYGIEAKELTDDERAALARDFEETVTEVLVRKTERALEETGAVSLILGGGVTANAFLRNEFKRHFKTEYPDAALYLPDPKLSTDNSIMIALAGHAHAGEALDPETATTSITASGNRSLTE